VAFGHPHLLGAGLERALDVGADGTALDAADAVSQADRLGLAASD
jgi:hypothetical protein